MSTAPADTDPPAALELSGRPGALRGRLLLRADTDAVRVAGATVTFDDATVVRAVSASDVVPPGSAHEVAVSVTLDRWTAPGEYPGHIVIAGRTLRLVARVVPAPRLVLTPGRLATGEGPVRVHAQNRGNVAVDVPRLVHAGEVYLTVSGPERLEVGGTGELTVTAEQGSPADGSEEPDSVASNVSVPLSAGTLRVTVHPHVVTSEEKS